MCPGGVEAHAQNVIRFSLRVPDASQTTGGKNRGAESQKGGYCGAIEVSGDNYSVD